MRTLAAMRANVAAIGTASEEAIVARDADDVGADEDRDRAVGGRAARLPARERSLDVAGARVGIILSGGNVDLDRLPWQT